MEQIATSCEDRKDQEYFEISLRGLALLDDPELLMNPHLNDYGDILLEPVLDAICRFTPRNKYERCIGIITPDLREALEIIPRKVRRQCDIVNGLHKIDARLSGEIPNKTFAESRLIPLIINHYL